MMKKNVERIFINKMKKDEKSKIMNRVRFENPLSKHLWSFS